MTSSLLGASAALTATALLAGATVVGKHAISPDPSRPVVGAFIFWRTVLAVPFLFLIGLLQSRGHFELPPRCSHVVWLGMLYFCFQTCWMWGVAMTTPFIAAVSSLMIPVLSLFASRCIGA